MKVGKSITWALLKGYWKCTNSELVKIRIIFLNSGINFATEIIHKINKFSDEQVKDFRRLDLYDRGVVYNSFSSISIETSLAFFQLAEC